MIQRTQSLIIYCLIALFGLMLPLSGMADASSSANIESVVRGEAPASSIKMGDDASLDASASSDMPAPSASQAMSASDALCFMAMKCCQTSTSGHAAICGASMDCHACGITSAVAIKPASLAVLRTSVTARHEFILSRSPSNVWRPPRA
ncbi:hypothetical protein [Cobetia crustatorum]|uniref:hypothetical protein n=1 Tax=Cobetia crustatorum TaxID=553385 RepID=UPI000468061E